MPNHYDAFISYGRANSKDFAIRLNQQLQQENLKVWFDQNDIPPAVDWQEQINDGIARADNFLFIISPHSVKSQYCRKEIELAVQLNKRIIPLLHVNADAEYDLMHPVIKDRNWLGWLEADDNFNFFHSFQELLTTLKADIEYVRQHTQYLIEALKWERNQQQTEYLLVGEHKLKAERWLKQKFTDGKQPPCIPTDLHCKYICESIKNAENLLTQVFICHDEKDNVARDKIIKALNRQCLTTWTNKTDIKSGTDYELEINKGIEGADNFVYLLTSSSIRSSYCLKELNHALSCNKRIIPLLWESLDLNNIPRSIQQLQFIDFTVDENYDQLIQVIQLDYNYYYLHKILLVKATKWLEQNRNSSLLLRGYNLQKFSAWLNIGLTRNLHPPLPLHQEFIEVSNNQDTSGILDIFISYSRCNADFARRLNDKLQELGKTTWFDQESIASGEDFKEEIQKGIASCDNFVFLISSKSINSPYCKAEVEYADSLNKRLITVLLETVDSKQLHPSLATVQWIDFRQGDFYLHFNELVRVLDTNREYIRNHNKWSHRALEWQEKRKNKEFLLRGSELESARIWLKEAETKNLIPPPTKNQKEYIHRSIKQKGLNQGLLITGISFALIILTGLWLRAERRTFIANLQENSARVKNLLATPYNVDGLILAISAAGKSKSGLGQIISSVEIALVEGLQTVKENNRFEGHTDSINSLSILPLPKQIKGSKNQYLLVSGGTDKNMILWDNEGNIITNFFNAHQERIQSVALHPDGKYIVSGSWDKTLKLWDLWGNQIGKPFIGHTDKVQAVAFSPDGKYIVSGSWDKTLRLWDLRGNQIGKPFIGHTDGILAVAVSPNGKYIVSSGWDNTLRLWDWQGNPIGKPFQGHTEAVSTVAFSPDSKSIISGSWDKTLRLWDLQGNQIAEPFRGHTDIINTVAFSPNGKYIVSGGTDQTLRLWDLEGNQIAQPYIGHTDIINTAIFSPDGLFILSGANDNTIRVWDSNCFYTLNARDNCHALQVMKSILNAHTYLVSSVAFSPDNKYIVSGSWDKTIRLWDIQGNPIPVTFQGNMDLVNSVAFSPDSKYIVSGGWDQTVRLWDLQGNQIGKPFKGHTDWVNSVAFSPNGKYIVSASNDKTIRLWDLQGNQIGKPFRGHTNWVNSVAFSPNGKYIVSGSRDHTLRLWDLQGNQIGKPFRGHTNWVNSVAFSPNSQYIVSGSNDKTIRLWNLQGDEIDKPFTGHTARVNSVSFNSEGNYIISASNDHTIRLWDLNGYPLAKPFISHQDWSTSVAFSSNDHYIVSGSNNNDIRLWEFDSLKLLNIACEHLKAHPMLVNPRTQTEEETKQVCQQQS